jgi:hypothetical protein
VPFFWEVQSDLGSDAPCRERSGHGRGYAVPGTARSPDGNTLAIGNWTYFEASPMRLWALRTGKAGRVLGKPHSRFWSIAFSPDGRFVACAEGDPAIHTWNVRDGKEVRQIKGFTNEVSSLCFSPDGKSLACGTRIVGNAAGDRSSLRLWDAGSGEERGTFGSGPRGVEVVAFSPDGKTLASGDAFRSGQGDEAMFRLWDVVRLIADLDSDHFMIRQKATEELSKLGGAVIPALRRALDDKPSLEVRRRVQQSLDQARDWTPERLRPHRAIPALERIGTSQAKQVLQTLAQGAPEARRTEEAKSALRRMSR